MQLIFRFIYKYFIKRNLLLNKLFAKTSKTNIFATAQEICDYNDGLFVHPFQKYAFLFSCVYCKSNIHLETNGRAFYSIIIVNSSSRTFRKHFNFNVRIKRKENRRNIHMWNPKTTLINSKTRRNQYIGKRTV